MALAVQHADPPLAGAEGPWCGLQPGRSGTMVDSLRPLGHNGSMKRFAPPLAILLALALGLGACGSTVSTSGFKGEAHAVAQRISDLQSDVSALNEQKICEQDFSRAARARLSTGGNTCKQALKRQLGSIDDYELTVEKIAVSGAGATARVRSTWSGKLSINSLKLVKEGGSWRVEGVG
jgi:Putative lumazine-binding